MGVAPRPVGCQSSSPACYDAVAASLHKQARGGLSGNRVWGRWLERSPQSSWAPGFALHPRVTGCMAQSHRNNSSLLMVVSHQQRPGRQGCHLHSPCVTGQLVGFLRSPHVDGCHQGLGLESRAADTAPGPLGGHGHRPCSHVVLSEPRDWLRDGSDTLSWLCPVSAACAITDEPQGHHSCR